jgi:hypothetical protein
MPSLVRKKPAHGWDGEKVEKGIWRRDSGSYSVKVSVNGKQHRSSFKTLAEARAFRDNLVSTRRPPVRSNKLWGTGFHSADVAEDRKKTKVMIEKAPRRKRRISGRTYTVVSLPYIAPVAPTSWMDLRPIPRRAHA